MADKFNNNLSSDSELELAKIYRELILKIGEDPNRKELLKTPIRAATTWKFMTSGYYSKLEEIAEGGVFACDSQGLIILKDIDFFSICEHHLLPIVGKCHIAYLPDGKVIGFSRITKIVEMFAHRLQLQENLTKEIATGLEKITEALGVGVVINAKHWCMMARGAEKSAVSVRTSFMVGAFKTQPEYRQEFLTSITGK